MLLFKCNLFYLFFATIFPWANIRWLRKSPILCIGCECGLSGGTRCHPHYESAQHSPKVCFRTLQTAPPSTISLLSHIHLCYPKLQNLCFLFLCVGGRFLQNFCFVLLANEFRQGLLFLAEFQFFLVPNQTPKLD